MPLPRATGIPAHLNATLRRLVHALEQANATFQCDEIRDQLDELDELIERRKLGLRVQQQSAFLRVETEARLGCILEETPRQPVGRPKKDSDGIIFPKLRDLGMKPYEARRYRRLNTIPSAMRIGVMRHAIDTGREITTNWVIEQCEAAIQRQKNLEPQPGGRIEDLYELTREGRRFGTILIDAPWQVPGVILPYPSMTPEQIAALPIDKLADPVRCHLHMWVLP